MGVATHMPFINNLLIICQQEYHRIVTYPVSQVYSTVNPINIRSTKLMDKDKHVLRNLTHTFGLNINIVETKLPNLQFLSTKTSHVNIHKQYITTA